MHAEARREHQIPWSDRHFCVANAELSGRIQVLLTTDAPLQSRSRLLVGAELEYELKATVSGDV